MRRAVVTLALLAAALVAAAPTHAAPTGPVANDGRWITDKQGRVLLLHGTNMVNKRPPYAPDALGFGSDDARFLADNGLNTVRLGVIYAAVEPTPGVYDDAYLDRIARTVETLGRHGILALLDFHQDLYNERFQGEGWPDWAVQDDGLPAEPKQGFPANYLVMPALQRAFDHFWDNAPGPGGVGIQDRYAAAWRHVAQRFAGNPHVLGYDLLNEPWPGTLWQECANPAGCPAFDAKLTAFTRRVTEAIRTVDRETLVFYEPNVLFNDGADTQLGDIGDSRAALSFHDYCLPAGPPQRDVTGGPGCDTFDDLVFANADKHAARFKHSLLLTEFGATQDLGIQKRMLDRADRFLVGWQEWHYCGCADPTTAGPGDVQATVVDPAKPPEGDNVKLPKLKVLAQAYPQVIAGTPRRTSFDEESRELALAYVADRNDGAETEIATPRIQYPDGYDVIADGASVRSAPGDPVLRVGVCDGPVNLVRVTVRPGTGKVTQSCRPPTTAGAAPTGGRRARTRLRVRPRTVVAGRRVRFRLSVTPARRATVRFAGRRVRTNARGKATVVRRLSRPGRYRARFAGARAAVRVIR